MQYIVAFALLGYVSKQFHYWRIKKGIPHANSYKLVFDLASWAVLPTAITLVSWHFLLKLNMSDQLLHLFVLLIGITSAILLGIVTGNILEGFNELSNDNEQKLTNYTDSDLSKIVEKELIEFINSGAAIFIKTNDNNIYTGTIINVDFNPSIPFEEKYFSFVPHYSIRTKIVEDSSNKAQLKSFPFNYITQTKNLLIDFLETVKKEDKRDNIDEEAALLITMKAFALYQKVTTIVSLRRAYQVLTNSMNKNSEEIFENWKTSNKIDESKLKSVEIVIKTFQTSHKSELITLATSLMPHKTMKLSYVQYISRFDNRLFIKIEDSSDKSKS